MRIRRVWKGLWMCGLAGLLLGGCTLLHGTLAVPYVSQTHGTVPLAISFDASDSHGTDGISTYHWSFGDGTDSYEVSGTHTFNHMGQYTIELTVRGADGATDTETIAVDVDPAFWVADENLDEIYKLDASGNVLQTLDAPADQPRGLAIGERSGVWSLYVVCMGGGSQRLIEMDPVSGTIKAQYMAPAQDPGGLTYAPVAPFRVWHVDRLSRKIYEINPPDGHILNAFGATYFQSSPNLGSAPFLQTPQGIAWKAGSGTAGALWVVEAETHLVYELKIVPAIDIFSSTQLALQPDPIALSAEFFPVTGIDWYDGYLWVVDRDRHQVAQVDPATGSGTGVVLNGFPGAAVTGLAVQK